MSTRKTASLTSDLVRRPQPYTLARDNDNPSRPGGRRSLVLTDESARHPFRASLNPRVKRDIHDIPAESLWRLTMDDARGFASVYFATTAAVLAFIV